MIGDPLGSTITALLYHVIEVIAQIWSRSKSTSPITPETQNNGPKNPKMSIFQISAFFDAVYLGMTAVGTSREAGVNMVAKDGPECTSTNGQLQVN